MALISRIVTLKSRHNSIDKKIVQAYLFYQDDLYIKKLKKLKLFLKSQITYLLNSNCKSN